MRGGEVQGPLAVELNILQAAEAWHIPPWQVEAECPRRWWQLWKVTSRERARMNEQRMRRKK